MRRREFMALLGGAAAAWPLAARAQQADQVRRIGVLMGIADDSEGRARVQAFEDRLRDLGWVPGRNLQIDYRWAAGDIDRIRAHAQELVGLKPEVMLSTSTPTSVALRNETQTIPIIFVSVSDPVGSGLVSSLARPGENLTGFTNFEHSLGGKWVELLNEMSPKTKRVAFLFNPDTAPYAASYVPSAEVVAKARAIKLSSDGMRNPAELERGIGTFANAPDGGLVVIPDAFTSSHRERIIELAAMHRLPAIYPFRFFATNGGLFAYAAELLDQYRRAATYVDRVFRGANPGELPVQVPTKFELVINLKTAKALGLDVPPPLLARADEVIE
jgi:putative tryptophan/tyrosine transport system substrate-binding protein